MDIPTDIPMESPGIFPCIFPQNPHGYSHGIPTESPWTFPWNPHRYSHGILNRIPMDISMEFPRNFHGYSPAEQSKALGTPVLTLDPLCSSVLGADLLRETVRGKNKVKTRLGHGRAQEILPWNVPSLLEAFPAGKPNQNSPSKEEKLRGFIFHSSQSQPCPGQGQE